jgi:hypothetical protein
MLRKERVPNENKTNGKKKMKTPPATKKKQHDEKMNWDENPQLGQP